MPSAATCSGVSPSKPAAIRAVSTRARPLELLKLEGGEGGEGEEEGGEEGAVEEEVVVGEVEAPASTLAP